MLDIHLITNKVKHLSPDVFIRENGQGKYITQEEWQAKYPNKILVQTNGEESSECFFASITHNLTQMAKHSDLYYPLWRPYRLKTDQVFTEDEEELEFELHQLVLAGELIKPLTIGLQKLKSCPEQYRAFNPSNGWGSYEVLIEFTETYLNACRQFPEAIVKVSR